MAGATDHSLSDCTLPDRVVTRFIEHRRRHAVYCARSFERIASERNWSRRRIWAMNERYLGIKGARVVAIQILERNRLDRREFRRRNDALRYRVYQMVALGRWREPNR